MSRERRHPPLLPVVHPDPQHNEAYTRPDNKRFPWPIDVHQRIEYQNLPDHRDVRPRECSIQRIFAEEHTRVELEEEETCPAQELDFASPEDES